VTETAVNRATSRLIRGMQPNKNPCLIRGAVAKQVHNAPTLQSLCIFFLLILFAVSQVAASDPHKAAILAVKKFQEAQTRYKKLPRDGEAAWQFARATFDLAEFATNSTERSLIAEQGIEACRILIYREPNSAPGHYYLGMNLAQLAQTRGIGALKLVNEMEQEFKTAREIDSSFDFGGPDRNLGLLYRDAPAIISIGSKARAKKHLERAVQLAPDYPENRLNLIESYLKWSDKSGVIREIKALEEAWPRARIALTGESWAASWTDWEARRQKIRKKTEEPSREIQSPSRKE
jgi:tetratricopeptide (TPR) repeat protein